MTQSSRCDQQAVLLGETHKVWLRRELTLAESIENARGFRKGLGDEIADEIVHWDDVQTIDPMYISIFSEAIRLNVPLRIPLEE